MTFPVEFSLFGHRLPAHLVMELIAYSGGFWLYRMLRRRARMAGRADVLGLEANLWIIVAVVMGAVVGSKSLAWAESFHYYRPHWNDPRIWMGGKTIVGGLLGGWIGVEIAKRRLGINHSTGDLMVFPLIFGIAVGRVGCFLTGLNDHTYGVATSLPWGVNFGDGIIRHPTQLYEIVFLMALAAGLFALRRRLGNTGRLFRLFMLGYLMWRFGVEFIKPRETIAFNLSAIQLASLAGVAACGIGLTRQFMGTPYARPPLSVR
ncbi:MAG: prolipoprotein diacylglyceryl transferase [Phycisphaerales bacterium]|nr:prolipoprotein diacylglyceryl transferase [Phycisphaerales bacterium]